MEKTKKSRKKLIVISIIADVILIILVACGIYLGTAYEPDIQAASNMNVGDSFTVTALDDGTVIYKPTSTQSNNTKVGIIFYQGGKVECSSYSPLLKACADKGIFCVLVDMPFNLAVFDINAADGIIEKYPEIESWYMMGHSLGGSMAAAYLEDNHKDFDGLILLGSYSTADISATSLKVLSVYGSEDKVMNREKYAECVSNLPKNTEEYIIDGGCHAYFGVYGAQKGDGTPTITNEEQILITAEKIKEFVY
ncbi:MAG: alpha/beta hydrolase [Clostridia bacterium]|nr:alpha/beta hydrolase [Clostridia bacterium]